MRSRSARLVTSVRMASVKSSTLWDLVIRPFALCATNSFGPPESETTTGNPDACASRITLPKVSVVLGKTKISADAYAVANSVPLR